MYPMKNEAFVTALSEILQVSSKTITEDYTLHNGNWDSVAVMATIALIDEQYNISVPGNELVGCKSVGQLLKLIAVQSDRGSSGFT